MSSACSHRTGLGFDSHAFADGGTLILGGIHFPGVPALKGHSDGDAVLHAVVDALLGAAGLGDIGQMFPDSDPQFKGAESRSFVEKALQKVHEKGLRPTYLDLTVIAEKPRLSTGRSNITQFLARVLQMNESSINIKAKTPEGLTWFAAPGGVAVWAVMTVGEA